MNYKLLDLFCCAGGAAVGYYRAFNQECEILGIDKDAHPDYPFDFWRMDALEVLTFFLNGHTLITIDKNRKRKEWNLSSFDFIHASPPCQFGTAAQYLGIARNGNYPEHENLIPKTRELILKTGKPYVIENVAGSRKHLHHPVMLCGLSFGLKVYRHRYFETSPFILVPPHIRHKDTTPSAGNGKSPKGFISVCGTGGVKGMTAGEILDYWRFAMGIDWMTDRHEIAEAIPPAYTEYIGRRMLELLPTPAAVIETP
jgi:DNA (cytosine-5)-methyltransferase 1